LKDKSRKKSSIVWGRDEEGLGFVRKTVSCRRVAEVTGREGRSRGRLKGDVDNIRALTGVRRRKNKELDGLYRKADNGAVAQ